MRTVSSEQKVRERILSDGYGKFDLVEDIFTKDEILNLKPRIVLKNITERLSIGEDQINRKTFWSWLRRYRSSNKPAPVFHHVTPTKEPVDNSQIQNRDEEWIKNFKPTMPDRGQRGPVIIKVIKSVINSQNQ